MRRRHDGAATVEFALVMVLFLTFFLGVTDFARLLWTWNAANEATRWGARISVVCDTTADSKNFVVSKMRIYLPQLTASDVNIDWYDAASTISTTCDHRTCSGVSVSIQNLNFVWLSPMKVVASSIQLPGFSTYLPREVMGQDPASNSVVCR